MHHRERAGPDRIPRDDATYSPAASRPNRGKRPKDDQATQSPARATDGRPSCAAPSRTRGMSKPDGAGPRPLGMHARRRNQRRAGHVAAGRTAAEATASGLAIPSHRARIGPIRRRLRQGSRSWRHFLSHARPNHAHSTPRESTGDPSPPAGSDPPPRRTIRRTHRPKHLCVYSLIHRRIRRHATRATAVTGTTRAEYESTIEARR